MLSYTDTQVSAYTEHMKAFSDSSGVDANQLFSGSQPLAPRWRQNNNKLGVAFPYVAMDDVVTGGYRRGKLPWRLINKNWDSWRRLDVASTIRIPQGSIVLPHAGILGCDKYTPLIVL